MKFVALSNDEYEDPVFETEEDIASHNVSEGEVERENYVEFYDSLLFFQQQWACAGSNNFYSKW